MRAAVANHSRVTRDALTGNGMDRHLFALRKLAEVRHTYVRTHTRKFVVGAQHRGNVQRARVV